MHTVSRVAALAGVSVRTLHHYDAIGLLRPAAIGANGYRLYDRDDLLRLQQILILRALGMGLPEIAAMLDDPHHDPLTALTEQRARIQAEAQRYATMLATIDRTIAGLKGDRPMSDMDLYSGIVDPAKQAEYEAWLITHHGEAMTERIAVSKRRMDKMSAAERTEMMAALRAVEEGLAEGLRQGIPARSPVLAPLLERHWAWVQASWGREAPVSAYGGLAALYLSHPDFIARYEQIAPGFSTYLAEAMTAHAERAG